MYVCIYVIIEIYIYIYIYIHTWLYVADGGARGRVRGPAVEEEARHGLTELLYAQSPYQHCGSQRVRLEHNVMFKR